MSKHYLGVDWSSGAWVTVVYSEDSEGPDIEVYDHIRTLWDEYGDTAERIVVDVPIGLCDSLESDECACIEADGTLSRECDTLARDVIGPRSSSVFPPPARKAARMAVKGADHSDVSDTNRKLTGKGLMQQAANISDGIVEVEEALLNGGDPEILVEGHPEVCFRAFNGADLQHSKKTAPGVDERLSALETVDGYDAGDWRALAETLRDEDRRVQVDDLLDALALGLTACAPEDRFHRLPQEPPEDTKGLPMQMVYRTESPFAIP